MDFSSRLKSQTFIICVLSLVMLVWHIGFPKISLFMKRRGDSQETVYDPGRSLTFTEKFVFGIPIDINKALPDDLLILPGIGPKTAVKIVAERGKSGPFMSPKDLIKVNGIGPVKLKKFEKFLFISHTGVDRGG